MASHLHLYWPLNPIQSHHLRLFLLLKSWINIWHAASLLKYYTTKYCGFENSETKLTHHKLWQASLGSWVEYKWKMYQRSISPSGGVLHSKLPPLARVVCFLHITDGSFSTTRPRAGLRPAKPSGIVGRVHLLHVHFSRLACGARTTLCKTDLVMKKPDF